MSRPRDDALCRARGAIESQPAVSPDTMMGRLAGYRLVAALEKDRRAERGRRGSSKALRVRPPGRRS